MQSDLGVRTIAVLLLCAGLLLPNVGCAPILSQANFHDPVEGAGFFLCYPDVVFFGGSINSLVGAGRYLAAFNWGAFLFLLDFPASLALDVALFPITVFQQVAVIQESRLGGTPHPQEVPFPDCGVSESVR